MEADFLLNSYRFALPETHIAQTPPAVRGTSRLMVLGRTAGAPLATTFDTLIDHLPPKALLIANNSKVIPARLFGQRASGGKVECLLLTPLPLITPAPACHEHTTFLAHPAWNNAQAIAAQAENKGEAPSPTPAGPGATRPPSAEAALWQQASVQALLRSSKKVAVGETFQLSPFVYGTVEQRGEFGQVQLLLVWQGDLQALIGSLGTLPLPPYIRRNPQAAHEAASPEAALAELDSTRYQTVYANAEKAGSVAAPTAGLHFTPQVHEALAQSGRQWAEATLYVGYGTFSPVRCEDIRQHPMHAEYVELPEATVEAILRAKAEKRPVIAVGTTSTRILEGVWRAQHNTPALQAESVFSLAPHQGWINLFLYPGEQFHVIDGLITNFHLPESSLLMLVSAFAGRERVLNAYNQAIAQNFRFFSYGDAMLITP